MTAAVWFLAAALGVVFAFLCMMSSELKAVNKRAKALTSRVVRLEADSMISANTPPAADER